MKVLKNIFFAFALLAGLSVAAFAQKEDKKPPPKDPPPVITPGSKNPPPQKTPEPPKKKPGELAVLWRPEDASLV